MKNLIYLTVDRSLRKPSPVEKQLQATIEFCKQNIKVPNVCEADEVIAVCTA